MRSLRSRRAVFLLQSSPFFALLITVLVFSSYPIVAFVTLGPELAFKLLPRELTWTFYCLIFLPSGFGLLVSTFVPELIRLPTPRIAILLFIVFAILSGIAVLKDAGGPKNPIEISSEYRRLQNEMLKVDACLRKWESCQDEDGEIYDDLEEFEIKGRDGNGEFVLPNQLQECQRKYGRKTETGSVADRSLAEDRSEWLFSMNKRHMYVCYYLDYLDHMEIPSVPKGPLGITSAVLNFVSAMYILIFVIWTGYVFYRQKIVSSSRVVYRLIASYSLFVTWFVFASWVQWDQWYGDLLHIPLYYVGFQIYFVFSVLCFILLTSLFLNVRTGLSIKDSIGFVYLVILALIGVISFFWDDAVVVVFASIRDVDIVFYLMTFLGVGGVVFLHFHAMIDDRRR